MDTILDGITQDEFRSFDININGRFDLGTRYVNLIPPSDPFGGEVEACCEWKFYFTVFALKVGKYIGT